MKNIINLLHVFRFLIKVRSTLDMIREIIKHIEKGKRMCAIIRGKIAEIEKPFKAKGMEIPSDIMAVLDKERKECEIIENNDKILKKKALGLLKVIKIGLSYC